MTYLKQLTNILLISVLITSCLTDIEDVFPKFKNGIDPITKEVASEISLSKFTIHTTKSVSTGDRTSRNLNVILTDASIKTFTQKDLELLSARVGLIIKQNVTNIDSYDWISILYETTDGSQASDSTDKTAYVYRPSDIK